MSYDVKQLIKKVLGITQRGAEIRKGISARGIICHFFPLYLLPIALVGCLGGTFDGSSPLVAQAILSKTAAVMWLLLGRCCAPGAPLALQSLFIERQGSMWVIICNSAMTEKSQLESAGLEFGTSGSQPPSAEHFGTASPNW